jgi:hypothetical protein
MLTNAGWELTVRGETFARADLEYETSSVELEIDAEDQFVFFSIHPRSGKRGITLKLEPREKLDDLLSLIVARQDAISGDDYLGMVEDILGICPEAVELRGGEDAEEIPLRKP